MNNIDSHSFLEGLNLPRTERARRVVEELLASVSSSGQGSQGPQGPEGPQGPPGVDGQDGAAGPQGPAGNDGSDGAQGPIGATGPQGPAGQDGADGAQGPQGDQGPTGAQGPTGNDGAQGPQGATGPQGPAGNDGADGAQGATGPAGSDGADGQGVPAGGTAGQILEKIDGADFNTQWTDPPSGGGSITPAAQVILEAVASASGNNLAGAKGATVDIAWDASVNVTGEVTGFDDGETEVQITNAGEIDVHASVGAIDNGLNNRTTLMMSIAHLDSADVLKYRYYVDDTYIRDDANTYDSGLMSAAMRLIVAAGDKIQIRSEVLDTQTTSGTMNASTTYSQLRIQKVTHS